MLTHQVERIKYHSHRLVKEANGICRFCGQIKLIEIATGMKDDEITELTSEQCDCDDSKAYAARKTQNEMVYERIDKLFAGLDDKILRVFYVTIPSLNQGLITDITINLGNGIKGRMRLDRNGFIKITKIDAGEALEQE